MMGPISSPMERLELHLRLGKKSYKAEEIFAQVRGSLGMYFSKSMFNSGMSKI